MKKPNETKLLKEAIKRGFNKGVTYSMDDEKFKINGDLFVRKMFKFGCGNSNDAFDYYVINHDNGNGFLYNGKRKNWGKILG
ncbi:MAG: hypothetical protein V4547_17905 [Bacteroidota bacterium]